MKNSKTLKLSAEFKNLLKRCENLDFDVLKEGKDGDLVDLIKEAESTPYWTGYTESENQIISEGKQKILYNGNDEYGQDLYDSGREFVPHHALDGSGKNAYPRDNWGDIGNDGYESTVNFVTQMITKELEEALSK